MNIQLLKKEQAKLSRKLVIKDDFDQIRYVAGCDQQVMGENILSGIVVLDLETMQIIEKKYGIAKAPINYIPGFLSYRESPAIVEAFIKLKQKPDVVMVDGNGIIHPRRMGIAAHIGIILDMPSIGVSKTLLLGQNMEGKIVVDGEVRGMEIKTKEHAGMIYVSPGHRISVKTAEKIVQKCLTDQHKLPEPLHEAHKYSKKIKRMLEEKSSGTNITQDNSSPEGHQEEGDDQ